MSAPKPSFTAYAVPIDFATLGAVVDTHYSIETSVTTLRLCKASKRSRVSKFPFELINQIEDILFVDVFEEQTRIWQSLVACRSKTCVPCWKLIPDHHLENVKLVASKLESSYLRTAWEGSGRDIDFLNRDLERRMLNAQMAFEEEFRLVPHFTWDYGDRSSQGNAYLLAPFRRREWDGVVGGKSFIRICG